MLKSPYSHRFWIVETNERHFLPRKDVLRSVKKWVGDEESKKEKRNSDVTCHVCAQTTRVV